MPKKEVIVNFKAISTF